MVAGCATAHSAGFDDGSVDVVAGAVVVVGCTVVDTLLADTVTPAGAYGVGVHPQTCGMVIPHLNLDCASTAHGPEMPS
jgi:hypothetical protein